MPRKVTNSLFVATLMTIVMGLVLSLVVGCGTSEVNNGDMVTREWTIMTYMVNDGAEKSDAWMTSRIVEMEIFGSTNDVQLAVQANFAKGAQRIEIVKNPNYSPDLLEIYSPITQELGVKDGGDEMVFADFVKWGITAYPAKKYMVILYGSGDSWKGFCKDSKTGNFLTADKIHRGMISALQQTGRGKIDIVALNNDMCGSVEVAYALKGLARYAVVSEGPIPSLGLDFSKWVLALQLAPETEPAVLAVDMTTKTHERWTETADIGEVPGSEWAKEFHTVSTLDLSNFETFTTKLNLFAQAALNDDLEELATIYLNTMRLKYDIPEKSVGSLSYFDIGLFLETVSQSELLTEETRNLALDAYMTLTTSVVLNNLVGEEMTEFGFTGLNIWAPSQAEMILNDLGNQYVQTIYGNTMDWYNLVKEIAPQGSIFVPIPYPVNPSN